MVYLHFGCVVMVHEVFDLRYSISELLPEILSDIDANRTSAIIQRTKRHCEFAGEGFFF
jgi:hypothetical protein